MNRLKHFVCCKIRLYNKIINKANCWLWPLLLLFFRFWLAKIFWYSGLAKISNWPGTLFLFQEEYKVPFLPHELAAYSATFFELCCPVLLLLGLASRFASLPLLVMTAVIQFTYLNLIDHLYWGMLLAIILIHGPGNWSLDYIISKKIKC